MVQLRYPTTETWPAKLDPAGRVVVPAELRERLHLKPGSSAFWLCDNGEVGLVSHDEMIRMIQAEFKGLIPPGSTEATDELFRERREEAAREDAEEDGGRA